MKKIATIGAALIDIYFQSESFAPQHAADGRILCQPYGHTIEISDHTVCIGGAATNTAVAFARRGHDVSIVAEIGRDNFGSYIKSSLIREGVNTRHLVAEKLEKTGCSVILCGPDGGRTVMVSRSASAMLDDYDIPLRFLRTRDWIHLSSVGGVMNALNEIWKVFDRGDMNFSWNPGKKELQLLANGTLKLPRTERSIFFVNLEEWNLAARVQADIMQAFKYVVITDGGNGGSIFADGQKAFDYHARPNLNVVDETGAGDAFAAAFVSTILYERPLEEAIVAALNNSESVIAHIGAKDGLLSY